MKDLTNYSTGLDHILHRNKPLHSAHIRVRNFALARLYVPVLMSIIEYEPLMRYAIPRCRVICLREHVLGCTSNALRYSFHMLVGFNIRSEPMKDLALESITSLRKKHDLREFSFLYSQLVSPS